MEAKILQFGELRKYISKIDPISICMQESKEYTTYRSIVDVSEEFNLLYVFGLGIGDFDTDNLHTWVQGFEITLSRKPRGDLFEDNGISKTHRDETKLYLAAHSF